MDSSTFKCAYLSQETSGFQSYWPTTPFHLVIHFPTVLLPSPWIYILWNVCGSIFVRRLEISPELLSWGYALVRPSGKRLFLIKWGGLLHCLHKVGSWITWLQTGMSLGTWIRCHKMILLQNGLIYIIGWKNGMRYKLVLLRWSFTTGWHWENWKGKKIREKWCVKSATAKWSVMQGSA